MPCAVQSDHHGGHDGGQGIYYRELVMLVLTRKEGASVDLYLESPELARISPALSRLHLGRVMFVKHKTNVAARLGFDMVTSVVVVRSELDLDNPPTKETVTK